MARAVELDREHGLPPAEDKLALFDQQGREAGEQYLAAVSMAVDRFVQRDVGAASEIIVLVPGPDRGKALEQAFEIPDQQGLVLVDRKADGRMQRLQVHAADLQSGSTDLVAKPIGYVDKLGRVTGLEAKALDDHDLASKARSRSSRVCGAACSEAAAEDI